MFRLFLFFMPFVFFTSFLSYIFFINHLFPRAFFNKTFEILLSLVLYLPFSSIFENIFSAFWSLLNILVPQPNLCPFISIYFHHLSQSISHTKRFECIFVIFNWIIILVQCITPRRKERHLVGKKKNVRKPELVYFMQSKV